MELRQVEQKILNLMEEGKAISVFELAALLNVSQSTVHPTLKILEFKGAVKHVKQSNKTMWLKLAYEN